MTPIRIAAEAFKGSVSVFGVNVVTGTLYPTLSFILTMEICYKRTSRG